MLRLTVILTFYSYNIMHGRKEKRMQRAFSMIELIFVIVIIAILAVVAIPKLAATRSDAEGTRIVSALSVCINDAGSAYMKWASFRHTTQPDHATASCKTARYCFDLVESDDKGSLTVSSNANAEKVCQEAKRIAEQNLLTANHVFSF